jgi:hypothetical protein
VEANRKVIQITKPSESLLENVYFKLYLVILSVEQDKLVQAENQIESFRKHIENKNLTKSEFARLKAIYRVLISMVRCSFDFKKARVLSNAHLNELFDKNIWSANSPELLIFEEWFEAKVKGVSYNHKTAVDNVKKRQKAMLV